MNKVIYIYRLIVPEFIRDFMYARRLKRRANNLNLNLIHKKVFEYLKSLNSTDKEIQEVINFLSDNQIKTIPIVSNSNTEIEVRKEEGMYYVDLNGKKMFFQVGTTKKSIIKYCKGIFEEQDPKSPHCYLSEDFNVNEDSIIADIGAAEGNFALSIVDKVKKVYIFEADKAWEKALKKTFEPWKDKVEIVFSLVSDKNNNSSVTLDEFFKDKEKPDFLKIDVEGYEKSVLTGAENILKQNKTKIAVCTYHKYDDENVLKTYLQNKAYKTNFSNGFMFMYENGEDFKEPYLRRGVLRAEKL